MLKVPLFAVAFVIGVLCVQRSAALISLAMLIGLGGLLCLAIFGYLGLLYAGRQYASFSHQRALHNTSIDCSLNSSLSLSRIDFSLLNSPIKKTLAVLLFITVAFCAGVAWATACAHARLQHALPKTLEQQSIRMRGVVVAQPQRTQHGWRMLFDVENVYLPIDAKDAFLARRFPMRVSLSYYPTQSYTTDTRFQSEFIEHEVSEAKDVLAKKFNVGERWQLTVSLKKLHSTINPHGFDFEAWAMSERLSATGTVKTKQPMLKLTDFVWQPRYVIAYARTYIQAYMTQSLQNEPHRGLLQALVMGDQSQITPKDWQVMLKTGTTHLMSISYLLKHKF